MSLYEDLGIAPDADQDSIKRAHRKAVKRLHPDNAESGDREKFEVAQRAFMVLSDPAKRSRYDETGTVDDNPANSLSAITGIIMNAFDTAMMEVGEMFPRIDMIARTRVQIQHRQRNLKESQIEIKRQADQIESVLKRVKFRKKAAFNPIASALQERISAARQALSQSEHEAEMIAAALVYLDNYGFDFTPMQTPESAATANWREVRFVVGSGA